jgi:hypothetical protein
MRIFASSVAGANCAQLITALTASRVALHMCRADKRLGMLSIRPCVVALVGETGIVVADARDRHPGRNWWRANAAT